MLADLFLALELLTQRVIALHVIVNELLFLVLLRVAEMVFAKVKMVPVYAQELLELIPLLTVALCLQLLPLLQPQLPRLHPLQLQLQLPPLLPLQRQRQLLLLLQ
jgi:hypothetical protein